MYVLIPFVLILFLEFVIEPIFKIRQRILHNFGRLPTGITLIIVTFFLCFFLQTQFPTIDGRLFTFSCIGLIVFFMPKDYEQYKKGRKITYDF
jgi:putative effector of murein hydrolase